MSDTDSIKTDKSQSDLQQKYDRLAAEFAKARMQLNVLKKAYTAITIKKQKSNESLDQFESCKYDAISTNKLDLHDDLNKSSQVNYNVQLLKQEFNAMNIYIRRVLESTQSNQLDFNVITSEIEYSKVLQNSCPNNFCEILNNDLATLKCSVTDCIFRILYDKLETRTKINTDDFRLIYHNQYCFDNNYKTDEDRFQNVFIKVILHIFLYFIVNVHGVLEYLLKEINPDAVIILQSSLKSFKNQLHSTSVALEKILIYCDDLKTLKFDAQYILMENILLFISNKYIEFVGCINDFMKSNDNSTVQIDCSTLRQNIISFMALKFPIEELVSSGEYWDSSNVNMKLNDIYDTVQTFLHTINMLEFEYYYKTLQVDMHWHIKNPFLHIKHTRKAKEELNSATISQNCYENIIQVCNEKLNQEINKSLCMEQEKIHWENEYKLLSKKFEYVSITKQDKYSGPSETFIVENKLGRCESTLHFNDEMMAREKELKCYFENKMNNLISKNKELSSQSNVYAMEVTALKTQLDHSISVRNELELKLQESLEHIEDLKEEFHLTTTNYETQIKSMTEHLVSLNDIVAIEQRHINDLKSQLKTKGDKKKKSSM